MSDQNQQQQLIYAKARGILKDVLPRIEDEVDPQVALVALMLMTAKTCRKLNLGDFKAVEVLAGNVPEMMKMWAQAEAHSSGKVDLSNVVEIDFGKKEGA